MLLLLPREGCASWLRRFLGIATYRIRPNYHTVRSGISRLLGKLVVKYVSTYTKGTLKKRSPKDLSNDSYTMFVCLLVIIIIIIIIIILFWFSL